MLYIIYTITFKVYTFAITASISGLWRDFFNLFWNYGQICHENLGCYANDYRSRCKKLRVLPYGPEQMDPTYFYLYTPELNNGTEEQSINYYRLEKIIDVKINSERPMYVLVHGFSQIYPFDKFLRPLKDELILAGNNVLIIDWIAGVDYPNYYQAASNSQTVGGMIANVLDRMSRDRKINLNLTTIIGYSLGVHVAAFAGKKLSATPVGSIVGEEIFID